MKEEEGNPPAENIANVHICYLNLTCTYVAMIKTTYM